MTIYFQINQDQIYEYYMTYRNIYRQWTKTLEVTQIKWKDIANRSIKLRKLVQNLRFLFLKP